MGDAVIIQGQQDFKAGKNRVLKKGQGLKKEGCREDGGKLGQWGTSTA